MEHNFEELCGILNAQTGKISWHELARHFARGVVVRVETGLSLVEVAAHVVMNEQQSMEELLQQGKVAKATDLDARRWHEQDAVLWAVVVAPWVLVQEPGETKG